ncbi:MAG: 50S ribosomal protein L32 [Candidatus Taylorbacteria bacterium RIFCSPHIGHO2_02_49_25]|uniref:Large ribosomal subunit protein bL32 n=1 Tax=Candidatus Taylorbacteria bacterium RIFCSPHIGHO2_02_49_25 TaxID=1802305 RepID=A0A1G2MJQ0_9BACT|nr:MAG: 50S ribosomal protein L32 [Candidatus Taylorbacteria bacterium RIFCSPHIGHO2_01_FULL_49_60]OHA23399.1 MAG: 50S ribosomal protein L32 [Candidatus Taylorbacteria bacterium RIFCSPHIGHO2_02_49_25]OHA36230.1 MAG: 50S ribosomal protein L32 [Candidatus Taylorbacteria bacterium RIFCSPLOWO2_02_50_13]OHA36476.1 MAG: 50S ribosomal protein L32 [Candidatus Taylorbacteria bacterium RIFCSPLOWO2_01_FULL_50_130]OHA41693.1 MAG: 50S ribosomal protein L32 [Candidatus Taylorbacteria bacterium RIFCSPLOWO2_02_
MVVRMRSTKSHRNNRRSHFKLAPPCFSVCDSCKQPRLSHTMCLHCGKYRGRIFFDVQKRIDKKQKKQKERAKTAVGR